MQLEATEQSGVLVARLSGRLDVNTAPLFSDAFQKFEKLPTVLDVEGLDYLSSAGLRALHIAAKGCPKLVVANFTGFCKEIYDVSGFSAIVPEFATVAEAIEALR